jgi:hypothetical protein
MIISVADTEGTLGAACRAQHGVTGAPWTGPVGWRPEALWQFLEELGHVRDLDCVSVRGLRVFPDGLLDFRPHDHDNAIESCPKGIEDVVVDDGLAVGTEWVQLL